ncbi:hypothetical protein I4U23_018334 [Adineta vaga]|nr:hypothetical protein I4U23_018334 [Adineta vaga]
MANNSTDRVVTTAHWVFKDNYDLDNIITKDNVMLNYISAMIEVASADGILSDVERRWITGYANATGVSQKDIDQLQNYQPKGMSDVLKIFTLENGHAHAKYGQLSMIYDAFRAAGSDGELHPKEIEAIYALGKVLGASEEQMKQLHEVYEEEQRIRRKRLSILFPQGSHTALTEVEKSY